MIKSFDDTEIEETNSTKELAKEVNKLIENECFEEAMDCIDKYMANKDNYVSDNLDDEEDPKMLKNKAKYGLSKKTMKQVIDDYNNDEHDSALQGIEVIIKIMPEDFTAKRMKQVIEEDKNGKQRSGEEKYLELAKKQKSMMG